MKVALAAPRERAGRTRKPQVCSPVAARLARDCAPSGIQASRLNGRQITPLRQVWARKNRAVQPAVFLDRDGTLIRSRLRVSQLEHVRPFVNADRALARLRELGYLLIVVTNQPMIETGEITIEQVKELNAYLRRLLIKEGVSLDAIYTCPHRRAAGCSCKKPELGLIRAAQKDFQIDMTQSWLIGDTRTDMETGKRAQLATILVQTGVRGKDKWYVETPAKYEAKNLLHAVRIIYGKKS
jgi:histidinol-phosphate phosphatase family protein